MAEKKNLTQRLNDVRSMISGVQKSKENTFEHYRYMDLNDISLKLKPALDKCGVVMWASAEEPFDAEALGMDGYVEGTNDDRGKRAFVYHSTLHLTIANCDDPTDCINVTFPIFGTNKNPEKAHGTALTYGYKYFFKNLFCINDGEDDADGMDEAPAPPKKAPRPKAEPKAEQKAEPAGPALFDLYALGRKKGIGKEKVDAVIKKEFGCKPEDMTKDECARLAASLETRADAQSEANEKEESND